MSGEEKISETTLREYYEDARRYLLKPWYSRTEPTYEPLIVGGEGAYFFDAYGKRYLDFLSQLFNVNLGIANKKVVDAVKTQVGKVNYTKNTFLNYPKIELAKKLAEVTGENLTRTFFSNSGTEANEAAFKISRFYTGRTKIIGLWNAYHGSTYASMSAGGVASNRNPFEPLVPGFYHIPAPYCYRCPFNLEYPECGVRCAKFLEDTIKFHGGDTVAAFIADPVVVSAGVLVPPNEYWPIIREICDRYGVLMILDEVITGCGRTGKLFAHEHWGIFPDVLTLAKGISNACVPLGATIIHNKIADFFTETKQFPHGFTYSGHALACAAGLAAINSYIDDDISANAEKMGVYLLDELEGIKDRHSTVGDVRGIGLIECIEFVRDKESKEPFVAKDPNAPMEERPIVSISDGCLQDGLLLMPTMSGSMLRISPPLIIGEEEVDTAVDILEKQITITEKRFL